MASMAAEQEEEVGVAVKEFSWQKVVWGPTHRIIGATDAQHRYGCLVHIPEGVVVVPVGVPADGEALGVAEEGLFKLSQGAAPEQFSSVHCVLQGCGVPGRKKLNGEGRKERKELENKLTAEVTEWQPTGQILTTKAFFGHIMYLKTSMSLPSFKIRRFHVKRIYLASRGDWGDLATWAGMATIRVFPPSFLCYSFYQDSHSWHYLPSPGAASDFTAAELLQQLSSRPHLQTLCREPAMKCHLLNLSWKNSVAQTIQTSK